jgi:hypothetical protein
VEVSTADRDLVVEGVELAKSRLAAGEELAPIILVERAGDHSSEQFAPDALDAARLRFAELLRSAGRADECALVRLGYVGRGDHAIVVELGRGGEEQADEFAQRFRPQRGRFRRFKLIGDLRPTGKGRLIP